jgi:hypothetical protein
MSRLFSLTLATRLRCRRFYAAGHFADRLANRMGSGFFFSPTLPLPLRYRGWAVVEIDAFLPLTLFLMPSPASSAGEGRVRVHCKIPDSNHRRASIRAVLEGLRTATNQSHADEKPGAAINGPSPTPSPTYDVGEGSDRRGAGMASVSRPARVTFQYPCQGPPPARARRPRDRRCRRSAPIPPAAAPSRSVP